MAYKIYKHYGEDVVFQQLENMHFINALKDNHIEYIELPILNYRVLLYNKDIGNKYAVIIPVNAVETCLENVYIATEIPFDMNWGNLVEDINNQRNGEKPMVLKTKAKLLCEEAEKLILENQTNNEDYFNSLDTEIDPRLFRIALITLGYSIEEVLEMDHHDVDEEYLRGFFNGKNNTI